jgi:hypothetical protein
MQNTAEHRATVIKLSLKTSGYWISSLDSVVPFSSTSEVSCLTGSLVPSATDAMVIIVLYVGDPANGEKNAKEAQNHPIQ